MSRSHRARIYEILQYRSRSAASLEGSNDEGPARFSDRNWVCGFRLCVGGVPLAGGPETGYPPTTWSLTDSEDEVVP